MASSPITSSTNATSASQPTQNDALRDLDVDQFLKLMITELQNQDPLNPTDNQAILEQINVIREITQSDKMVDTLDSVLLGQNISSASNMIGKKITALDDAGKEVSGQVDRVTIVDGQPKLHVGGNEVQLNNVRDITV